MKLDSQLMPMISVATRWITRVPFYIEELGFSHMMGKNMSP